jgi:hypothetical protein
MTSSILNKNIGNTSNIYLEQFSIQKNILMMEMYTPKEYIFTVVNI